MRWRVLFVACLASTIAWSDRADARGSAQLQFVRRVDDGRCPDETELRRRVGAQLGYDPFEANASTRIEATIERRGGLFHGRVTIRRDGAAGGERDVEPTRDCEALVSALALTISVAIDPISISRPPPPPPPPPPAPPSPAEPAPAKTDEVAPVRSAAERRPETEPASSSRAALRMTLAPSVSVGIAPSAAPGLSASVGAGWPVVSLALEGRLDLPASAGLSIGGEVSTSVALATFVPCVHLSRWVGCALASVGSMRAESRGISAPGIDYSVFAAAGVRGGIELPISKVFAVRPQIDVQAALTRPTVELNGRAIWTVPPVSASFGVALVARIGGGSL